MVGADSRIPEPDADPLAVARGIALARLTLRAHSEAELRTVLSKKNTPPEVVDELMARFREVGLVDDAGFAKSWVTSRHEHRGASARSLRDELRRKGVDRELIDAAVAGVDHDSELAAARGLAERKLRSLRGVDAVAARRRLMGALSRRGYASSVVVQIVNEVADRLGGADDDELSSDAWD